MLLKSTQGPFDNSLTEFFNAYSKVIAHGADRADALRKLRAALENTAIEGIATNLAFQRSILASEDFARGGVDTGFLARSMQKEPA